jgi:uncharacterized protein (DUF58 family)
MKEVNQGVNQFFTTDFCPWANKYVYWMKQPLGWFALAAAASMITGLFVSPKGWLMLACCLVVIALQLCWPWVQMKLCSCEVSFDRSRIDEWTESVVKVTVTNHGPFPLWGMMIEQGFFRRQQGGDQDQQIAVTLSRVPAFSTNVYHWSFVPERRGVYPLSSPRISTAFPFGIWTAHKQVSVRGQLVVWPRTVTLYGLPKSDATGIAPLGAMQDRPGDQGDILGSRVWQPGESLRMVNWAQTSRCEEDLIVLERQSCARPKIHICLDFQPEPAEIGEQTAEQQDLSDWQIRVAASLLQLFHGHQYDLKLSYAGTTRSIGPSKIALHSCLDDLARLDPGRLDLNGISPGRPPAEDMIWITTDRGVPGVPVGGETIPIVVGFRSELETGSRPSTSGLVLVVDDGRKDVFEQLSSQWRALQRAQQAC